MDRIQQLQARYTRYAEEAKTAAEQAPALAGFLGFGSDPRKDPCHVRFYEDVEQWVREFLEAAPAEEDAFRAAEWMIRAAADHRDAPAWGFLYAAQGHCRPVIGLLSREHCAELMKFYDENYPRRDRMPVQDEVYRMLKKGAGRKR